MRNKCKALNSEKNTEEVNIKDIDSNSANYYFQILRKIPRLSEEEKNELIQLYYNDSKTESIRQKLISDHLLLVVFYVTRIFKIKPNNPAFMDLIQEGNKGLVIGIDAYDLEKAKVNNKTLSSYLFYWIKAYVFDSLVRNHRLIRIKNGKQRKFYFRLAKAKKKLLLDSFEEKNLSMALLAKEMEMDEGIVTEMYYRMANDAEISLHQPIGSLDSGSKELSDIVPDQAILADAKLDQCEWKNILHQELLKLRNEEFTNSTRLKKKRIIENCFLAHLDDSFPEKSLKELAEELGEKNIERMRDLQRQIANALRTRVIDKLWLTGEDKLFRSRLC